MQTVHDSRRSRYNVALVCSHGRPLKIRKPNQKLLKFIPADEFARTTSFPADYKSSLIVSETVNDRRRSR